MTRAVVDGSTRKAVKVGEIMGLALRLFSNEVSALPICKNILWVFSETQLSLDFAMRVSSKFWTPFDI
jgi:hypothetical protein